MARPEPRTEDRPKGSGEYQLEMEDRRRLIRRAREGDSRARTELFVMYRARIWSAEEVERQRR